VINIKEDAKKMAALLKSGYTMLNLACPVCNNPVFRDKNGDTFCPICNRKVLLVNHELSDDKDKEHISIIQNNDSNEEVSTTTIYQNLKRVAIMKVKYFTDLLENEKDIEIVDKITHSLIQLITLISKINE
jgi:uncharacterized Zn finger protein (UPF0148 family)